MGSDASSHITTWVKRMSFHFASVYAVLIQGETRQKECVALLTMLSHTKRKNQRQQDVPPLHSFTSTSQWSPDQPGLQRQVYLRPCLEQTPPCLQGSELQGCSSHLSGAVKLVTSTFAFSALPKSL